MNSSLTLQQLIYAVAVDSNGSFVLAAEECKVSQPALSMQIRKLENTLGVTLFDRSRQPVRPTELGRRIVEQARSVLREAARIQEIVDVAQGEMRGVYDLGADRSIARWLLPAALRRFSVEHPAVIVAVREASVSELTRDLEKGELDAALIPLPTGALAFEERELYYEPFVAYVPRSHRLYSADRIDPEELEGAVSSGTGRPATVRAWEREHITPGFFSDLPIRWEGGTLDSLCRLAEEGLGVALLPRLVADELRDTDSAHMLREFTMPQPHRAVGLVLTSTHTKGYITDALIAAVRSAVPAQLLRRPSQ